LKANECTCKLSVGPDGTDKAHENIATVADTPQSSCGRCQTPACIIAGTTQSMLPSAGRVPPGPALHERCAACFYLVSRIRINPFYCMVTTTTSSGSSSRKSHLVTVCWRTFLRCYAPGSRSSCRGHWQPTSATQRRQHSSSVTIHYIIRTSYYVVHSCAKVLRTFHDTCATLCTYAPEVITPNQELTGRHHSHTSHLITHLSMRLQPLAAPCGHTNKAITDNTLRNMTKLPRPAALRKQHVMCALPSSTKTNINQNQPV
jgi:hypothetical protein